MKLSIILATLLSTLANGAPNLCDDVYLDATGSPYTDSIGQTLPRYCEWTGPDAPVWDSNVCCTIDEKGAHCSQPDSNGRCRTGLKMYCEYGAAVPGVGVVCYQPFPSMCDLDLCVAPPDVPPPGHAVYAACCSSGGVCQLVTEENAFDCPDDLFVSCTFGTLFEDGTVECYD